MNWESKGHTRTVLKTLYDAGCDLKVNEIAELSKLPAASVSRAIQHLRVWSCVKFADPNNKKFGGYVLTEWGVKVVEDNWGKGKKRV
jgi:hypothetical protein